MKTLNLKTVGAAEKQIMTFSAKEIADAIQYNISGRKANAEKAEQLTQDFIDTYEIKARYASGTFLSFKISDEAEDAFEEFVI